MEFVILIPSLRTPLGSTPSPGTRKHRRRGVPMMGGMLRIAEEFVILVIL
jgi:hypothetical protein